MNPVAQSVEVESAHVTILRVVENAQEINLDHVKNKLFFPIQPFRNRQEYEEAEKDYQNELKKSNMVVEHVNKQESRMIQAKINHGIAGKSIEEDDDPNNVGPTSEGVDPNNVRPTSEGVDPNNGGPTSEGVDPNNVGPTSEGVDPNNVRPTSEGVDPNNGGPTSEGVDPNNVGPTSEGVDPNNGGPTSEGVDPNNGGLTSEGVDPNNVGPTSEGVDPNNGGPTSEGDRYCPNEASDGTIIEVTNLPKEIQKEDLHGLLTSFGPVSHVYLAEETMSNTSESFALITFHGKNDAEKAMEGLSKLGYGLLMLKVES